MGKDIHDNNIDGEKIEATVIDDKDIDLDNANQDVKEEPTEADSKKDASQKDDSKEDTKESVSDEKKEDAAADEKEELEEVKKEEPPKDSDESSDKDEKADDVSEESTSLVAKQDADISTVSEGSEAGVKDKILSTVSKAKKIKFKYKDYRRLLIIPAILLIIAGMFYAFTLIRENEKVDNLLNEDYFYEGVYIDGIAVGGLTYDEAYEAVLASNTERAENVEIALLWDDERIVFGQDDVDISFNTEEILDAAWQEGRSGTDRERYNNILALAETPVYYTTEITIDPSNIEAKVKAVALFRERDPGEASVEFNPDPDVDGSEWFTYTEPEVGIETDPDELWELVLEAVAADDTVEVEIPKTELEPTTTIEDLKDVTQLIVQFTTSMSSNENREHNVALACSMINGTVVMPGETFSFNETTGERTEEAGFLEANVIVSGNMLIPGIAGGVCQVSGTLFNAVVRADLEIVERNHHSFELSYLTRGRDATVNYGTADFQFKNTSDYPIYISMYVIDREVYAEIYGMPLEDGVTIELYVKTTETIAPGATVYVADSSVAKGTTEVYSARTGIKCTTYKDYYDADGKLIERVELYSDYYREMAEEVHYNPASGKPK